MTVEKEVLHFGWSIAISKLYSYVENIHENQCQEHRNNSNFSSINHHNDLSTEVALHVGR